MPTTEILLFTTFKVFIAYKHSAYLSFLIFLHIWCFLNYRLSLRDFQDTIWQTANGSMFSGIMIRFKFILFSPRKMDALADNLGFYLEI
jgi:hypothetical protein